MNTTRFCALLLALLCLFAGCDQPKQTDDYAALTGSPEEDTAKIGLAYLGYGESAVKEGITASGHTVSPVRLDAGGDEAYLLVPRYETTRITVRALGEPEEDGGQTAGDVLMESTGESLLLICNPSDLFSNVEITVEQDDESIVFSPYIQLKDGTLAVCDGVREIAVG